MTITEHTSTHTATTEIAEVTQAFFSADHDTVGCISIQRCTDWLLDLYQSDERPKVRRLIAEVIEDLQLLGSIDDADTEDLVLGALASVEAAIEMADLCGRW